MEAIDDRRGPDVSPERLNLTRHVLWSAEGVDDKAALLVMTPNRVHTWPYETLRALVLQTAGGLLQAGMRPGQRLLMRLGNTPDFPIVFLGAVAAGIIPVPTSAALNRAEVSKLAAVLSPDAVVTAGSVPLPDTCGVDFSPDDLRDGPPIKAFADTRADDPAYIVFTSGTSGTPTGVVHAHRAIWARRAMIAGWEGLTKDDRILHAGAFNWTYTLGTGLLDPWSVGATALVLGQDSGPDTIPELAKRNRATILAGAPGIFRKLNGMDMPDLPDLRHALSAGEKLPETVRAKWTAKTGTDIHEAFGQSECSTFLSGAPHRPAPAGTVGFVQPGRAAAILGQAGIAPRGTLGRIAVHRSDLGLMLGYLGREAAPQEWVATGDLGVMREDGAVEYHGRADDVLTSGGFRLSPIEIEEAMHQHAGIQEAAAVDFQLNADTRVIKLYFTASYDIDEAELRAHAQAHLAAQKCPRLYERLDHLPRNSNGKLLRKNLRTANESL
ncbi:MAG: acyl--CoA ligase [Silicimonas sp.]|nr:acyl--CoA ligase [Silicimonas sp.]